MDKKKSRKKVTNCKKLSVSEMNEDRELLYLIRDNLQLVLYDNMDITYEEAQKYLASVLSIKNKLSTQRDLDLYTTVLKRLNYIISILNFESEELKTSRTLVNKSINKQNLSTAEPIIIDNTSQENRYMDAAKHCKRVINSNFTNNDQSVIILDEAGQEVNKDSQETYCEEIETNILNKNSVIEMNQQVLSLGEEIKEKLSLSGPKVIPNKILSPMHLNCDPANVESIVHIDIPPRILPINVFENLSYNSQSKIVLSCNKKLITKNLNRSSKILTNSLASSKNEMDVDVLKKFNEYNLRSKLSATSTAIVCSKPLLDVKSKYNRKNIKKIRGQSSNQYKSNVQNHKIMNNCKLKMKPTKIANLNQVPKIVPSKIDALNFYTKETYKNISIALSQKKNI